MLQVHAGNKDISYSRDVIVLVCQNSEARERAHDVESNQEVRRVMFSSGPQNITAG
jgi:hypothetical protein